MAETPQIFLSYAHRDSHFRAEFGVHLKVLEHIGIRAWTDRSLDGGDEIIGKIKSALEPVEMVILLVSQYSLASDFIREHEISSEIRNQKYLYPILIRECAWKSIPWLRSKNMRPYVGNEVKPVAQISVEERDKVYAEMANEISGLLKSARA